ncbi:MAG: DUF2339 domain-containing protein [Deltaproteobacteria bacterium]
MDVIAALIGVVIFALIIVGIALPIWAIIRAGHAERAAKKQGEHLAEIEEHVRNLDRGADEARDLQTRLTALESEVKNLQEKIATGAVQPPHVEVVEREPKLQIKPVSVSTPPPATVQKTPLAPRAEAPGSDPKRLMATPPAAIAPTRVPPPVVQLPQPETKPVEVKSSFSLEETLGTDWLNKLGIIILVIGIAFFLGYQIQRVGPAGKILTGYLVSLALMGLGVFYERRATWRILARAGIGGGWALAFFTTYAMNHVPASRVIQSESADFFLMFLVGVGMVAHTLRYRSQVVTGLAFLLAFSTINISHGTVSGLWAGVILCAGLAWIAVRRSWFELEIFGLLAAYVNHYYWLRPIVEPMAGHHHAFPEATASTILLIAYWLIFRGSYIVRKVESKYQENVSTVAALLNTFLFHSIIAYQAAHPELAFWFLFGVGSTEMALGQLPVTKRQRTAFVMLSTIGAVVLVSAFSYRYSAGKLSVAWLLESEALLLAGIFTREVLFRRLGVLVSYLVVGHMMFVDAIRLADARNKQSYDFSDPRTMLIFAVAAAVLYANSHWFLRKNPEPAAKRWEVYGTQALSFLGGFMALLAVWAVFHEMWWSVGWAALGVAAAVVGARWKVQELSAQASAFLLLAIVRVFVANFSDPWPLPVGGWLTRRLLTVILVAACLYLSARWSQAPEWPHLRPVAKAYAWVASFLVLTLAWYEFLPVSVALAWMLVGLALFELGISWGSWSLRLQGYLALLSAFARMFYVNLNAAGYPGQLSPRFYTTLPLAAAFFYVYWRLDWSREEELQRDRTLLAGETFCFCATIAAAGLMRFELNADYVSMAWAALTAMLLVASWRFNKPIFLHQGLLLGVGVLFRCLLHNIYERTYFPGPLWHGRTFTVGVTVALLLAGLPFAFRLRKVGAGGKEQPVKRLAKVFAPVARRPEQIFFFFPTALLTVLLAVEMRRGLVTLAWGVEAVAIFLFALWVKERSFRLTGLGLLLLCVVKIVVMDVWSLQPSDRYLTFVVLGIALIGVSFLYTRYRETLRQYL